MNPRGAVRGAGPGGGGVGVGAAPAAVRFGDDFQFFSNPTAVDDLLLSPAYLNRPPPISTDHRLSPDDFRQSPPISTRSPPAPFRRDTAEIPPRAALLPTYYLPTTCFSLLTLTLTLTLTLPQSYP